VTPLDLAHGHDEMLQLLTQGAGSLHKQNPSSLLALAGQSQRRPVSAVPIPSTFKDSTSDAASHQEPGPLDLPRPRTSANQRPSKLTQSSTPAHRGGGASRMPALTVLPGNHIFPSIQLQVHVSLKHDM
jgi:hypothetical protein